ncbi:centrosomal protein of 170 kDa isoform X3 [Ambystoma mexicanum]|uniref:centrosomal protein of 170 kDa isoform X3 n=1 Tax=Ambystoma mexicanum TaxID=8296 RepID=UPI0037E8FC0C
MSLTSWFLVSSGGTRHRLPREMIFVGRDDCELMLQSRSVDKQHAVVNYDTSSDEHLVKDLGSLNGTFVNDVRIPEQTYITLKLDDKLRFGYDTNLFTVVRCEMRVPEEALKHEKFTSQLQFSQKSEIDGFKPSTFKMSEQTKLVEGTVEIHNKAMEVLKSEERTLVDPSAMPRGTPLYGQPSWWGDEDAEDDDSQKQDEKEGKRAEGRSSGCSKDVKSTEEQSATEEAFFTLCREPSYFEIPTKEFLQSSQLTESTVHETPTKDTLNSQALGAGHASFTIEFDDHAPGKVTIKDHVTKFTPDPRHKSKKPSPPGAKELSGLHTEMLAAENKVADWLAQNNPPRMVRERAEEESKSIKSDVPVFLKRLKGNKHDDGTQSDSENTGGHKRFMKSTNLDEHLRQRHMEQRGLHQNDKPIENQAEPETQTAFMIEFFDECHPRKRRSYSFSQTAGGLCPEAPFPTPHLNTEKAKPASGDSKGLSLALHTGSICNRTMHNTQQIKHLLKQTSDEPSVSLLLSQSLLRSSGSLGHRTNTNNGFDPKAAVFAADVEKDNDDDLSDKGTYTIESDCPNPEEVKARKMIDKVFGVDSGPGCSNPVVKEDQEQFFKDWTLNSSSALFEGGRPQQGTTGFLDMEENIASSGSKRWVSQWASLAANHTSHDQDDRLEFLMPASLENDADISESGISVKSSGSTASLASQNDRKRRTLPKLPKEEKTAGDCAPKVKPNQRSEIGEKQDTELQEKETPTSGPKKERQQDLDFKGAVKSNRHLPSQPLKSASGSIQLSQSHRTYATGNDKGDTARDSITVKQALSQIQHQEQKDRSQWTSTNMSSTKQATNQTNKVREQTPRSGQSLSQAPQDTIMGHSTKKAEVKDDKRKKSEEIQKRQYPNTVEADKKEPSKPLVRQGSFTIDKPSTNVPIELIPHIDKKTASSSPSLASSSTNQVRVRRDSVDMDSSMDTTILLKDTEAVMAFLEAKLREENRGDDGPDTPSYTQDNSISPESDVDTASTISLVAGDGERKCNQKRKSFTSLYKERCPTGSHSKDVAKSSSTSAREKSEKKVKSRSSDSTRTETRKALPSSGRIRQPSLDLTDDDQTSSVPHSAISDILSSDQETYSGRAHGRAPFSSADELLHPHSGRTKMSHASSGAASKSVTLPRPRPTRTSLLRRARLGETSDTEPTEGDKGSVASEVSTTSSTSKPPTGKKVISRLDLLAQPRRTRLGSISARSDSEAIITRSSTSSRTPESVLRSGLRAAAPADTKYTPRARANSISRLSDSKTKSMAATHSSPPANSRWRRLPSECASTSEDEFGSNRNSPKHTRLRTSPVVKSPRLQNTPSPVTNKVATATVTPPVPALKHRIKEQEDYIRDWTAHREEIARLKCSVLSFTRISQDLALIAREINDVAGEIDSVTSSGTAPSTTVSTAATTPGSAIDTKEELVERVFDESLNFRKIPPLVHAKPPEANGRMGDKKPQPKEMPEPQTITRRKTWSRDEAMGDSLLLSSVFQFSRKIRQAIDKTAGKIRILFKDQDRNWDEIENKLRAESEIPVLKTSSMEILSILQELKRVEKQLQVINAMIDPDGTLDALNSLGFGGSILPCQPKPRSAPVPHSLRTPVPANCQPEPRAIRPAMISVSSEFGSVESEPDFSIHFNRFNPDGEEEDTTLHV